MNEQLVKDISKNLGVSEHQIITVVKLLDEGNTIPFIARYRKEATGGLDENQINDIYKEWEYQNNLYNRKEDVIRLIDEKGLLTPELKEKILKAEKLVEVEDLYRPFKEKKKTKATEAIKKGLEPFAKWMLTFPNTSVKEEAKKYIGEKKAKNEKEAIEGAQYIIAEIISDNAKYRKALREELFKFGNIITTKKKNAKDEKEVYKNYYEYEEPIRYIKPHRVLAINRAEKEKVINVKLETDKDYMLGYLDDEIIPKDKYQSTTVPNIQFAIGDSLDRLIYPSIEREIRSDLTNEAEEQSIKVFSDNLNNLLLQPPLKGQVILGVDPAFRTGCKLAVINKQGDYQENSVSVIHPLFSEDGKKQAKKIMTDLIVKFKVELIAIGNGTASRETEKFVAEYLKETKLPIKYVIVNEAGASVYSASDIAQKEFPDFSVEQRSAISIARRIQDPLAELVKIDPKSIGVGQYQHDVTPKKLNDALGFVVTKAVNSVGVNVNTASASLLTYVSGLGTRQAQSIIKEREKIGRFKNRNQLKDIPYIGDKKFEQAIGFLRIQDGEEPLDQTAIHPESYDKAQEIMKLYEITPDMFGKQEVKTIFNDIDRDKLSKELNVDTYTLDDIIDAFIAPQRDPRDEFPQPILKSDILTLDDIYEGMKLEGTIRNVVDFGAFVDVGLSQDGLIHISNMSTEFIKHPSSVVEVGQIVTVYVIEIDKTREKVGLSLLSPDKQKTKPTKKETSKSKK